MQLHVVADDADHRVRTAVQTDLTSDERRIAVETSAPQPFAHDDDGRGALFGIGGQERPAGDGRDAEHIEEARGDRLPIGALQRTIGSFDERTSAGTEGDSGQGLERARLLFEVAEVERRHTGARHRRMARPDHDEPIGLRIRKRTDQRRVSQREYRAVRADAERQRERRDHGKGR